MSTVTNGNTVSVHYRGTLENGIEFDSSHSRGQTLTFEVGAGQMIPGFDTGVVGMSVGETRSITINPEDAYGEKNPEAVQEVSKSAFPEDFEYIVDGTVEGQGPQGPVIAKIVSEQKETVTLDFNHPLAGEVLNFEIELVDISGQSDENS